MVGCPLSVVSKIVTLITRFCCYEIKIRRDQFFGFNELRTTGNSQFVWRVVASRSLRAGERVELSVAAGHLHFFDAQTEEAVA